MTQYSITEFFPDEKNMYSSYDDIIKNNLTKKELKEVLIALLPYLDPNIFEECSAFIFEQIETNQIFSEEETVSFLITKKDTKCKK